MILTMPPAVPLATRPTHTSALYLCFSFLRRAKEQTHVSPRITLKERAVEEILFLSEKTQSILILENNTCFSLFLIQFISVLCIFIFILIFCFVSEQVLGPPVAGAYRERPSNPTTFRKFYERRELPVALLHDTKGQQIVWKVGVLPSINQRLWCSHANALIKVLEWYI